MMSKKKSIESTVTGSSYKIPSANCKSKNLVYCAECLLCQKQYTGKTTNKLQQRISGHRSHVNRPPDELPKPEDTDEATLAEHLNLVHNMDSVELFNLSYSFTVLQLEPRNIDKCEQKWISQLVTLEPYGLNKEKPCGVADSILTMSKKVKSSSHFQRGR